MNKIIIVSGDPNSINSEIIYKSWKIINKSLKNKIYVISNYRLLKNQFKKLKYPITLNIVKNINEKGSVNSLNILNIDLKFKNPFNVQKIHASKFVIQSLNYAHKLAQNKEISGIINCPINKTLFIKEKIGVTEFLANKCKVRDNSEVMLIRNKKLSVCPVTTHINVKEISKKIKSEIIIKKINTIQSWFKRKFKKKPKIAILGLNPHNSENKTNSIENKIIRPALIELKKLKININGPFPADTAFNKKNIFAYDVIVGMYHDQVLAPFKALYGYDGINLTLGLKYLRLSPDHGTAMDIVGLNRANPQSLISAINFLNKIND